MARIKKQGIDYFPMDNHFKNDRRVWRMMKREGDSAFTVLVFALSQLYQENGYYIPMDESLCEDLADCMFQLEAKDVRRILTTAIEVGLFDKGMFEKYGILTSADIQRQYLFSTRRRNTNSIEESYCLLTGEEVEEYVDKKAINVAEKDINATITPEKCSSAVQSTQSIEKHSIEKKTSSKGSSKPLKEWRKEDIDGMSPPDDGVKRNFEGLKEDLELFKIPIPEQYAIIRKSNYGQIGHPVWRGFYTLRDRFGKIHSPGKYLLSLCV